MERGDQFIRLFWRDQLKVRYPTCPHHRRAPETVRYSDDEQMTPWVSALWLTA
jgi:hypothetical protein